MSALQKRYTKVETEFYAIGQQLRALNRPDVIAFYGHATFNEFVEAHIMPATSARRFMTVSEHFTKQTALRLGVYKAYHLVRYVEVTSTRQSAASLAEADKKIGTPGKRISELTTRELETLVQTARLRVGRQAIPQATRREKSAVRSFERALLEQFGVDPKTRIDKKRGVVKFEVPLSELLDL